MDIVAVEGHPISFVPEACTLPTADRPLRLGEFEELFGTALRAIRRPAPTRLDLVLDHDPGVESIARDLADRETACCSFFAFTFAASPTGSAGLELGVEVSDAHVEVLDGLQRLAASAMRPVGPTRGAEAS